MRNIDPEQYYRDMKDEARFKPDNDDADICGPDENCCEMCGCDITDENCSSEDVVCNDCLPIFCARLRSR